MRHLALLSLLLTSCQAMGPTIKLARTAATFVSVSDPILRGIYAAEQDACLTEPKPQAVTCVSAVRSRWAPVRAGLVEIREAWCDLEPWKCKP